MKYKFIVDENIFYCAIRGVDEYDKMDTSSARFLAYLLKNCHKIYLDEKCNTRFKKDEITAPAAITAMNPGVFGASVVSGVRVETMLVVSMAAGVVCGAEVFTGAQC